MSDSPAPAGRSFPAAWLLLLIVPVGLLVGRMIAALPVPEAQPSAASPASGATASGPIRWRSYDAAMAEARASGKPVLIDFSADWCPPCQRLKRDVFENSSLARAVEAVAVPVSIVDRRRETGSNPSEIEDLQRQFAVEGFPTLVVLSPATGRHVKDAGFGGAEYTVKWIEDAARQVR